MSFVVTINYGASNEQEESFSSYTAALAYIQKQVAQWKVNYDGMPMRLWIDKAGKPSK
jgi:hypothetical protein